VSGVKFYSAGFITLFFCEPPSPIIATFCVHQSGTPKDK